MRSSQDVAPGLFPFVLISVFIGATVNLWIPGRGNSPGFGTTAVIVVLFWFAYSALTHLLCRVLRGRGRFKTTLSAALVVFAVAYVLSNFTAMLWGIVITAPSIASSLRSMGYLGSWLVEHPDLYLLFQFIFLAVYLPISLKEAHNFGWIRQLAVGIIMPFVVFGFGLLIISTSQEESDRPLPRPHSDSDAAHDSVAMFCCDIYGNRRCPLVSPMVIGSQCFCPGQGEGISCP